MSSRPPPPKPWERARGGTAPSSATPSAEGLPKPWESPSSNGGTIVVPESLVTSPSASGNSRTSTQAPRPWESTRTANNNQLATTTSTSYSPYSYYNNNGTSMMYNRPYGMYGNNGMYFGNTGMYGNSGMYYGNSGMYGNNGMYYGNTGIYGNSGMYGRPFGPMMMGHQPGWDPNDPHGPPVPPTAWQAMLAGIGGIMHFFGRLSFLVDENAHAVHFFVTALLQLLDRFGSLYGELARFVLRILGFHKGSKAKNQMNRNDNINNNNNNNNGRMIMMAGDNHQNIRVPHQIHSSQGNNGPPSSSSWDGMWVSGNNDPKRR